MSSSFGNAWTCDCGHTLDASKIAHATSSNWLSFLMQSRYNDTKEMLKDLFGRLGFSSSREGGHSQLAPHT
jgi:hypothetical protein